MTSEEAAVRRDDVQYSLERLRSGTFDLIELLRREGLREPSQELSDVIVALQSVANQLGRIEALEKAPEAAAYP